MPKNSVDWLLARYAWVISYFAEPTEPGPIVQVLVSFSLPPLRNMSCSFPSTPSTIRTPYQWPLPPGAPVTFGIIPSAILLLRDATSVLVRESLTQSTRFVAPEGKRLASI